MRALFVAAAVVLSVTALQAQEMVGEKSTSAAGQESADRAVPPAAATPTSTIIEQLKAPRELKETKTLEAPAPHIRAAKPAEAKPVETRPDEAAPAGAKPVEAAEAAETKAVEGRPVETKPVQAMEAKPAKKRAVGMRETDEQKARRIAAKYGIHW